MNKRTPPTKKILQLDKIIDLLGSPNEESLIGTSDGARDHVLKQAQKKANYAKLYAMPNATKDAVHLLVCMLKFDYEFRYNVLDCLEHPYLDEGRLRYHSSLCSCCGPNATTPPAPPSDARHSWEQALRSHPGFRGANNCNFEPEAPTPFRHTYEDDIGTLDEVKSSMHAFIMKQASPGHVPLCINTRSSAYKSFSSSPVIPQHPDPHNWG